MASPNATPGSADEYASKEYIGSSSKLEIHGWLRYKREPLKWGFPIIRCSYSSQPRWEQYVRAIRSPVDEKLDYKEDTRIREALEIPIIEDETLDGATWEQARDKFDAWVLEDLKKSRDDFSETWKEPGNEQLKEAIHQSLRWEFFIFADQASIDSVVDCDNTLSTRRYFTIGVTGLIHPRGLKDEDDENNEDDSDDSDEITPEIEEEERILAQRCLYQKFRATDYLELYGSILDSRWPDEYFDHPGDIHTVYYA